MPDSDNSSRQHAAGAPGGSKPAQSHLPAQPDQPAQPGAQGLPAQSDRSNRPTGTGRRQRVARGARAGRKKHPRRGPRSGRAAHTDSVPQPVQPLQPGEVEVEFGVPLAGVIQPPELWARTALKHLPESGPLDLDALFGRTAPRVLDIGCGNGRFLLASAVRRPEVDHIGIDLLPMVIRYATRRANQRGLSNCRWAACDGHRFLGQLCPPGALSEIHVYHPQPFDRRSQTLPHKRAAINPAANRPAAGPTAGDARLFNHEFLKLVHRALTAGGRLFVQTDNLAYWSYLETVLGALFDWHVQEGAWQEDPAGRTRREIVAMNKGLKIFRGWGTRRDDLKAEAFAEITAGLPQPNFDASHQRNPRRWRRPRRGPARG